MYTANNIEIFQYEENMISEAKAKQKAICV